MRKFILIFLFLTPLTVLGQETKELKQVKLKSGISITGYVINNADGSISVTTVDGDQLWYSSNEIQSVSENHAVVEARRIAEEKAKADAEAEKRARKDAIQMKEKGFQFIWENGLYFASNSEYMDDPIIGGRIYLIPGYRFNKKIIAGVGIGYRTLGWDIDGKEEYSNGYKIVYEYGWGFGPTVVAKIAYNFKTKRVTPYYAINMGYCLTTIDFVGMKYRYDEQYDEWWLYEQGPQERAEKINAYFLEGDFGWMFRTRKGSGLNIGLSLTYSPVPSSVHNITMHNSVQCGVLAGWTF